MNQNPIARPPFLILLLATLNLGWPASSPCHAQVKDNAKQNAKPQAIRILFVGNSYTSVNNLPAMIQRLAAAGKDCKPVEFKAVTPGGCAFQRHFDEEKFGTRKAIAEGQWDFIVLQEQSQMPFLYPDATLDYGKKLGALVKEQKARSLLYLTWARENQPENQAKLNDTYTKLGQAIGAPIVPVGPSWEKARAARSDLLLYSKDKSHPSPAGTYLAACVFHAVLHGKSPAGLPSKITTADNARPLADLAEKDAAFLQRIAWETVQTWNKEK